MLAELVVGVAVPVHFPQVRIALGWRSTSSDCMNVEKFGGREIVPTNMRRGYEMPFTSEKYKEAAATLPDDLVTIFQRFVEEYEYLTHLYYGRGYVAYKVLADLILAGWRPSAAGRPGGRL